MVFKSLSGVDEGGCPKQPRRISKLEELLNIYKKLKADANNKDIELLINNLSFGEIDIGDIIHYFTVTELDEKDLKKLSNYVLYLETNLAMADGLGIYNYLSEDGKKFYKKLMEYNENIRNAESKG